MNIKRIILSILFVSLLWGCEKNNKMQGDAESIIDNEWVLLTLADLTVDSEMKKHCSRNGQIFLYWAEEEDISLNLTLSVVNASEGVMLVDAKDGSLHATASILGDDATFGSCSWFDSWAPEYYFDKGYRAILQLPAPEGTWQFALRLKNYATGKVRQSPLYEATSRLYTQEELGEGWTFGSNWTCVTLKRLE